MFVNALLRACAEPTRCEAGLLLAGAENDIPDSFLDKEVRLERYDLPPRASHIVKKLSASPVGPANACVHAAHASRARFAFLAPSAALRR